MLSILILSQKGEGKEIADKLINEGHVVKFWVESPEAEAKRAEALYPWQTIDRYEEAVLTADLCIFTSSGIRGLAEDLRKRGKMVVGGIVQDLLVKDAGVREAALSLMNLPSVSTPGTSISFCGLYDGKTWFTALAHRYTRLMDGERGPELGLGCILTPEGCSLEHLTPILEASGYRGYIGIELTMTSEGVFFEKFNTGIGGLELSAISEVLQQPLGEMLYNLAAGRLKLDRSLPFGLSIKLLDFSDLGVFNPPSQALKHCWRTFDNYCLGYVSAGGTTPNEARRRAYRTVYNSVNLDTIYRKDIGAGSIFEEEV